MPLRTALHAGLAQPLPPLPPPPPPPPPPEPRPDPQAEAERRHLETALAGLAGAVARLDTRYRQLLGEMRQTAIELAIAVADRLLHDQARAGQVPLEEVVRQVVGRLPARGGADVSLNPEDVTLLRRRLGEEALAGLAIQLRPDPGLARGSCRAEAEGMSVLSDLEEQLADLRHCLLENVGDAEPRPG